ncbi:MAG: serine/threonine protein kinase [Pirellulales bacterium]|nr:serine/threonine protein kinase [Pirellulales bacterium]
MRTEVDVESLLELVERSGVVAAEQMRPLRRRFQERPDEFDSPRKVARELVAQKLLTRWQAEQLLQGKHRGFFLGPYRILDLLGSGGMGSVYLAEHQMMRRRCAIKVLPPKESKRESSTVQRFYREAQAVAALDHPNIVRAYDVNKTRIGETEVHYLAMEYVDGQDLQRMVEKQGGLDYRQAADYMRQAANGLAHADERGLVHRDIKPANLIVDRQGVVKILDLGLACFGDDDGTAIAARRGEGVVGTADYLAPEQAVYSRSVDSRSDIYSLGQTFYFALTGHPPFPDGTVPERLFAHKTKTPEPITNTRPDAPPGLLAIIDKMTAKQPEKRYASAKQVVEALDTWLTEGSEEDRLQALAERAVGSREASLRSPVTPTRAVSNASDDTDLELAPLEDEKPLPHKPAAKDKRPTPAAEPARRASDSRAASVAPTAVLRKETGQGGGAVSDDLPDLLPLETDLVTTLEENDLISALLAAEPATSPLGGQGPLSGPNLRKRRRKTGLANLVELPAFWIGAAGLFVLALIVAFVLSRSSSGEAPPEPEPPQEVPVPPPTSPTPPVQSGPSERPPPPPPGNRGGPPDVRPQVTDAGPEHGSAKPQILVPVGSTWRWLHPTDGVDPATTEKAFHGKFPAPDYDDSHWQTGQDGGGPEGGFGYSDAVGVSIGEPADGYRKTAYFRCKFKTDAAMENLVLRLQRDDGVIIYLDGREVARDNVDSGAEAYDLFARDVVPSSAETELHEVKLTGALPPGEHVIAISLHNRSAESSDLRIAEISLEGVPAAASNR